MGIDWRDPPVAALGRRVLRLAIGEPAPSAERVEALLEAAAGERGGVTIELGGGRVASVTGAAYPDLDLIDPSTQYVWNVWSGPDRLFVRPQARTYTGRARDVHRHGPARPQGRADRTEAKADPT